MTDDDLVDAVIAEVREKCDEIDEYCPSYGLIEFIVYAVLRLQPRPGKEE